jgi:hypothetical protein
MGVDIAVGRPQVRNSDALHHQHPRSPTMLVAIGRLMPTNGGLVAWDASTSRDLYSSVDP